MKETNSEEWTEIITSDESWFNLKINELWNYRDLVMLFVWRDFVATYKQTLLGPAWHFVNPILSTIINTLIFGVIANISTEGVPAFLFQLCSISCWGYFNKIVGSTQGTFSANAGIFGKVYFPRLVVPISSTLSILIQLGIMLLLFSIVWIYYKFMVGLPLQINLSGLYIFPLMLILMTLIGFGLGSIIAASSTKYRDLNNLIGYGITILMYSSAVVFPISAAQDIFGKYAVVLSYNPMVYLMEGCRYSLLNIGSVSLDGFIYCTVVGLIIFFVGIIAFNRTAKDFIDSV